MDFITAQSTTAAATVRARIAAALIALAFALITLAARSLNPEHPVRTFLAGRVDDVRGPLLRALA